MATREIYKHVLVTYSRDRRLFVVTPVNQAGNALDPSASYYATRDALIELQDMGYSLHTPNPADYTDPTQMFVAAYQRQEVLDALEVLA